MHNIPTVSRVEQVTEMQYSIENPDSLFRAVFDITGDEELASKLKMERVFEIKRQEYESKQPSR